MVRVRVSVSVMAVAEWRFVEHEAAISAAIGNTIICFIVKRFSTKVMP